jgi:site-specific DNA-methyltransferase (adenine-specific)
MAEPYWTDGTVSLYLGDCREVTEWLAADVLVTDPPYGRGWKRAATPSRSRQKRAAAPSSIANDEDTAARDDALAMWSRPRCAAIFGDLLLAPPAGSKITLIYRKAGDAGCHGAIGGFRRDAEAVYLIGPWGSKLGGRSSVIETAARAQGSPSGMAARYGHPHAKPVDVMETLIAACPPGTIADPFAGSGSTLVAARNAGRRAVGVEIDERYCELAARRLSQAVMTYG